MESPGRTLCSTCYRDLGPGRFDDATGVWLYECEQCPGVDGPLTVEVPDPDGPTGLLGEFGVPDAIRQALGRYPGRWLEFGVVEHLYAQVAPDTYRALVERFGHRAIEEATNTTASWLLGRALWQLKRDHEVLVMGMPHGTGRWGYLRPCHAWSLPGGSENATVVTWEAFAAEHGFDPLTQPAIDWRGSPDREPATLDAPE
ncbi:hypothetical protein [Nitriliruptor alkaliphilus]|uniref:hypothetical protein n=1 Tax=Nitriliruptor alkaliphilus TaxID=427918 RepID=UPI000697B64B|nr:hypothetical protein [Nitriliruptor alkaliphilus]